MACYYDNVSWVLTPALAIITGVTIVGMRMPFFKAIKWSGVVLIAIAIYNAIYCGDWFFALHTALTFFLSEISTILIGKTLLAFLGDGIIKKATAFWLAIMLGAVAAIIAEGNAGCFLCGIGFADSWCVEIGGGC